MGISLDTQKYPLPLSQRKQDLHLSSYKKAQMLPAISQLKNNPLAFKPRILQTLLEAQTTAHCFN